MMRVLRRSFIGAAVLVFFATGAVAVAATHDRRHSQDDALFSRADYQRWLGHLASDELEGRGTGQVGNAQAGDYIAGVFEELGVRPAGDDGTFFQNFTLQLRRKIGTGTRFAIGERGRRARRPARLREDFVPLPLSSSGRFRGDVVFAGYGIVNEDKEYDDYADVDVAGKVVLILRRGPAFGEFGMRDRSFRAKASRAKERDAAALLIVNRDDEDSGLYPFDTAGGRGRPGARSYDLPMLHVTPELADRMLSAAGMPNIRDLQARIERTGRPISAPLQGVSAEGVVRIEPIDTPVRNVVGLIPGKGPQSDEIIVLGAHYDHLGIRKKGKPGFDPAKDISNGADDNASGTSLVMTLARVFTRGEAPNRSILLIAFTGEELGLLGSRHFVKHPTVELGKCVTMFNFDMVGRLKEDRLEVGGMRTGGFEETIEDLAEHYGLKIKDGGGGRGPSDHTNFYNVKIPVLFFFTGIHRQYHRPTDDADLINYDGAMRIARFAADVIDAIDGSPDRPEFQADRRRATLARQGDKKAEARAAQPETPGAPAKRVRLGVMAEPEDDVSGILVAEVVAGSPAARAGVKPGDRIVKIGDTKITGVGDAVTALEGFHPGDQTTLRVRRDGAARTLRVSFGKPKRQAAAHGADSLDQLQRRVLRLTKKLVKERTKSGKAKGFWSKRKGNAIEIGVKLKNEEFTGDLVAGLGTTVGAFLAEHPGEFKLAIDVGLKIEGGVFSGEIRLTIRRLGQAAQAKGGPAEAKKAERAKAKKKVPANPHGDLDDASDMPSMPPVRLGIMPAYGESEGEGFEISGVVEGGAAAKAGMRDNDHIYSIGPKKITNVYEYMDALRRYKPGDVIPVVVIRDGKKVTLQVTAEAPKSKEAA